jgi:exopolysaccharide production protein ExoQ
MLLALLACALFVARHDLLYPQHLAQAEDASFDPYDAAQGVTQGDYIAQIALIAVGVYALGALWSSGVKRLSPRGYLGMLLVAFVMWSVASVAWADDPSLAIRRIIELLICCIVAIAVSSLYSLEEIMVFAALTSGIYLLIGVTVELAYGSFHLLSSDYRFSGTLQANHQAWNCAILCMACAVLSRTCVKHRVLARLGFLCGLSFLLMTRSRTGAAACAVALIAYGIIALPGVQKAAFSLMASIGAIVVFIMSGGALSKTLFAMSLMGRAGTTDMSGRTPMWQMCYRYIVERPLTGYGYDAFWSPAHVVKVSSEQGWNISVGHSVYLDTMLGVGAIGLIILVLIMMLAMRRAFTLFVISRHEAHLFALMLLLFVAIDSMTESIFYYPELVTIIGFIILAKYGIRTEREVKVYSTLKR